MDSKDENLDLLDLALGELSPEAEAELRLLIAGAPEKQAELAALEEALSLSARIPVEDPPRSMDDAIMAAARRHVAKGSAPEAEPLAGWQRFVQFLREAINGPQAAMATITLLVVAVGLWFIPTARREGDETAMRISDATRPPPEDGETVLEPAASQPEPEQTATGGVIKIELEEARRLEETKMLRARRVEREQAEPQKGEAPSPTDSLTMKRAASKSSAAPAPKSSPVQESEQMFDSAPAPSRAASSATAAGASPGSPYGTRAAAPSAPPPPAVRDEEPSAERAEDASKELADSTSSRISEAERLFRARSFGAASSLARQIIAEPRKTESGSLVNAYDVAARSERALGRCSVAIPLYRTIVANYPGYARRAAVLGELEECEGRTPMGL